MTDPIQVLHPAIADGGCKHDPEKMVYECRYCEREYLAATPREFRND